MPNKFQEIIDPETPPGVVWIVFQYRNHEDEFQGVFTSEKKAIEACRTENHSICPAKLNEEVGQERTLWPGAYYPHLQPRPSNPWDSFVESEIEKIKNTGVLPDYIHISPDEKSQEDLLNQRLRPNWEKSEGLNDFEQCEKMLQVAASSIFCTCGNPSQHITGQNSDLCYDCRKVIQGLQK